VSHWKKLLRTPALSTLLLCLAMLGAAPATNGYAQMPGSASPVLNGNDVKRVSEHVYVIRGFPNVEFVVGNRATLAVDTGMGARNGQIVFSAAQKLTKPNANLYLTTTHYHAEHASGAQAFPSSAVLLRPVAQQKEMDEHGAEFIEQFRNISAIYKELLQDAKMRPADVAFDSEVKLDLGDVSARLFWLGPAHTIGDELIFVEPDSALLSGDIVMSKLVPSMPTPDANPKNWLAILGKIEPLHPHYVIPDHGELGDATLIEQERAFLMDLEKRALELKGQGKSVDDAGKQLTAELQMKYPDWGNFIGIPNAVRRVYEESQ
jgi:glyoxylase-like metal-dependent hydrolase (beta-lactamase superfamily II)